MATIVFCEDDLTIQKLIGAAMRRTTHRALVAQDGAEGLVLIRRERPDLVCTDLSMPGLDGFELMAVLKGDPELASVPIILLTASAQRSTLDEGKRRGATAVVVKPFSTATLCAEIERVLALPVTPTTTVTHVMPVTPVTPAAPIDRLR